MIRDYYRLTKPGIVYGNAITAAAGFFLGSDGRLDISLFFGMLFGICAVMASACVFNNYLDRGIDSRMERTKKRALASGKISNQNALIFATTLGIAGFLILGMFTNLLSTAIAAAGFVVYVVIYGIAKRRSVHGTVVGSISGAVPPIVGYCSATNQLDGGALLLFIVLVCWQMPHFYAIAIYRLKDYKEAGIPVLPLKRGIPATKHQILGYIAAFIIATLSLTVFGYSGYVYAIVMLVLGLSWLRLAIRGLGTTHDQQWAKQLFRFSLVVLLGFSLMISINSFLP